MDPLTMIALGNAGMSGVQAINSGIKGQRAQGQLNQAQQQADQTYQQLVSGGQGVLQGVVGNAGNYATPTVGGAPTMFAGGSPGGGLAGMPGQKTQSGKGAQAGVPLDQQILNMGMDASTGVAGNHRATADALGNQGLADQAAGMFGQGFQSSAPQGFDFQNPQNLAEQMTQTAIDAGNRARVGGREQLAMQMQGAESGLNAQLASRGLSPNSGAAVSALTQNAVGANQALAGLERNIADMTGQAAMQGAQLDTQNLLNLTNMSSNFTMGNNQIQAGLDQAANQYNLGAAQGMAGLQGMQNDVTMQQGALRNAAYTEPLGMLQGLYQQNYLQPQMQMQQLLAGVGGQMLAGGLGGTEAGLDRRSEAVSGAGSGKGSSMGNAQGFATDAAKSGFGSNKGAAPGSVTPSVYRNGTVPYMPSSQNG
jgi:hypothetical protein